MTRCASMPARAASPRNDVSCACHAGAWKHSSVAFCGCDSLLSSGPRELDLQWSRLILLCSDRAARYGTMADGKMYTLYSMQRSGNCYKARLALAQLGVPYTIVDLDILKGDTRTPEFLAMNPGGRVPVLEVA